MCFESAVTGRALSPKGAAFNSPGHNDSTVQGLCPGLLKPAPLGNAVKDFKSMLHMGLHPHSAIGKNGIFSRLFLCLYVNKSNLTLQMLA